MQTAYSHKYPALRYTPHCVTTLTHCTSSKLQSLSKTFDRWVVEFTGGRLLSRPGLGAASAHHNDAHILQINASDLCVHSVQQVAQLCGASSAP